MESLSQAIAQIDRAVGQPHPGRLPLELFLLVSRLVPLFTVDLWIEREEQPSTGEAGGASARGVRGPGGRAVLLTWREDDFFGRGWHVPGSALRLGDTTQHRLRECGREELGAEIEAEALPFDLMEEIQPHIHDGGDPRARDRAHNVSAAYRCRLLTPPDPARAYRAEAGAPPQPGQWAWHARCPDELLAVHRCYEKHFPARTDR